MRAHLLGELLLFCSELGEAAFNRTGFLLRRTQLGTGDLRGIRLSRSLRRGGGTRLHATGGRTASTSC